MELKKNLKNGWDTGQFLVSPPEINFWVKIFVIADIKLFCSCPIFLDFATFCQKCCQQLYLLNINYCFIDVIENAIKERLSDMEGTGDNIMKHINQKTDEILLTIKTQQVNAESPGIHSSDTFGKLCSFLLHAITIINNVLYDLIKR